MTVVLLILAAVLACEPGAPATLPPAARIEPTAIGRMVRAGDVIGYIARPLEAGLGRVGTLLLVEQLDDQTRADAVALAEAGGVALVVEPSTDQSAAHTYLSGMPDVARVVVDCRRTTCP